MLRLNKMNCHLKPSLWFFPEGVWISDGITLKKIQKWGQGKALGAFIQSVSLPVLLSAVQTDVGHLSGSLFRKQLCAFVPWSWCLKPWFFISQINFAVMYLCCSCVKASPRLLLFEPNFLFFFWCLKTRKTVKTNLPPLRKRGRRMEVKRDTPPMQSARRGRERSERLGMRSLSIVI